VPIIRPSCSGCVFVLMEGSAEAVVSSDIEVDDQTFVGDRFRRRTQRGGLMQRPMRAMLVVVALELAQRVQQVSVVPDQGAVQQFVSAGTHPTLHHGVHSRHPDPGEHDRDAGIS
jgi:hypothetical protein